MTLAFGELPNFSHAPLNTRNRRTLMVVPCLQRLAIGALCPPPPPVLKSLGPQASQFIGLNTAITYMQALTTTTHYTCYMFTTARSFGSMWKVQGCMLMRNIMHVQFAYPRCHDGVSGLSELSLKITQKDRLKRQLEETKQKAAGI